MEDPEDGGRQAVARRVADLVDELAPELVELSHAIHAEPELAFEERFAASALAGAIERRGLEVERGAYGLDTAFAARAGTSGPHVVVCLEYDALPEIGHACGHNVIAATGLGAGLALAAVARDAGGRVTILGTPAEERDGGKILMAERGAFRSADAAMMVHPAARDLVSPRMLAMVQVDVEARGQEAHAAGFPWRGRNALDAIVLGYTAVAALRQHVHPDERIHGIITHGGDAPNIVPKRAAARFNIRSTSEARLERLHQRVMACFEGGATASGCDLDHRARRPYADLRTNGPLADAYQRHAAALGRPLLAADEAGAAVGSTDMGNVSKLLPSIHPMVGITTSDVALHTEEFARHAVGEHADRAIVDAAKALARTALDLWRDPALRSAVRREFETAGPASLAESPDRGGADQRP